MNNEHVHPIFRDILNMFLPSTMPKLNENDSQLKAEGMNNRGQSKDQPLLNEGEDNDSNNAR